MQLAVAGCVVKTACRRAVIPETCHCVLKKTLDMFDNVIDF